MFLFLTWQGLNYLGRAYTEFDGITGCYTIRTCPHEVFRGEGVSHTMSVYEDARQAHVGCRITYSMCLPVFRMLVINAC